MSKKKSREAIEKTAAVKNLVFEGGGVLGYAYVGVVQVLEERNILQHCKCFAGASAGAMTAGLLACGARADMLCKALGSLDAREMVDSSALPLLNLYRFWHAGGWAKGQQLEQWYGDLLVDLCEANRNITLAQVFAKFGASVVLSGTCLDTRTVVYFSKDSHPNMPLVRAVRISAGYPCLFPMIEFEHKQWWDGGIGDNFPIHVFDSEPDNDQTTATTIPEKHCTVRVPNPATVGFKLVSKQPDSSAAAAAAAARQRAQPVPINNVYDAIKSVATMVLDMSRQLHVHEIDWQRSVLIDVGTMSATHFDIDDEEKKTLIANGRRATEAFLEARTEK